jgi:energy-converting hydrogenase A subunit M
MEIQMKDEMYISDKKIAKLAKRLSKTFTINEEEAMEVIYEEWDLVESLFHTHTKVKAVHSHLIDEINYTYRIA